MSTGKNTDGENASAIALERRFDAVALNAIVNHPEVYPWVRGAAAGVLDLSAAAEDPDNVLLCGDLGAILFTPTLPAIWEVHTQVLPEGRGTWARAFVESALRWMFVQTNAAEILTRVPEGNIPAAALARAIGGRPAFRLDHGWNYGDEAVSATVFSLTVQDWLAKHTKDFALIGSAFADALNEKRVEAGALPSALDPERNAPLGVALEMLRFGHPNKAAVFFNRWASFAGRKPLTVLSADPLIVELAEGVLWFHATGFELVRVETAIH